VIQLLTAPHSQVNFLHRIPTNRHDRTGTGSETCPRFCRFSHGRGHPQSMARAKPRTYVRAGQPVRSSIACRARSGAISLVRNTTTIEETLGAIVHCTVRTWRWKILSSLALPRTTAEQAKAITTHAKNAKIRGLLGSTQTERE